MFKRTSVMFGLLQLLVPVGKMSKQAQEEGEAEEMAQDSDAQEPSNEASDEDEPSAGVANQDGMNSPCLGKQKEAGQNSESGPRSQKTILLWFSKMQIISQRKFKT